MYFQYEPRYVHSSKPSHAHSHAYDFAESRAPQRATHAHTHTQSFFNPTASSYNWNMESASKLDVVRIIAGNARCVL